MFKEGVVLLFGCGKKEGVFATNKKLPHNQILSNLSFYNKHTYT
jgi:hypothetical protein